MITRQEIWDQLGKRPFQQFRITLKDGEKIEIFRKNQAIITTRQFIYVDADDHIHWIQIDKLQQMEVCELGQAAQ
jgi:hypothetical protein